MTNSVLNIAGNNEATFKSHLLGFVNSRYTFVPTLSDVSNSKLLHNVADFYNGKTLFVQDLNVTVQRYSNSIRITDLSNAGKRGKEVLMISVSTASMDFQDLLSNFLADDNKTNAESFVKEMLNLEIEPTQFGARNTELYGKFNVSMTSEKATTVFNPLTIQENLKPIKSLPAKLTKAHVTKIIANGQFDFFRCDLQTTDDYAFDNANNFFKGDANAIEILKDMKENSRAYHVSYNSKDGKQASISISFASCKYYTLSVDLNLLATI